MINSLRINRLRFWHLLPWLCLLCLGVAPNEVDLRARLTPSVWEQVQAGKPAQVLVVFQAKPDLSAARFIADKTARGKFVYDRLVTTAQQSQSRALVLLRSQGVLDYRSFFIINALEVVAPAATLLKLAALPEVRLISANPEFQAVPDPQPDAGEMPSETAQPGDSLTAATTDAPWNIAKIRADQVWSQLGVYGEGIVVAVNDTGVQWDHPALKSHYRGWGVAPDGEEIISHDYNWHDAAQHNQTAPYDDYAPGHGTHTAGIMVGDDGYPTGKGSNHIGVAPGAKWIACKNMDGNGNGSTTRYIECLQWFLAPTDRNGQNPRPDLAPHIINNSWVCTSGEGCEDMEILRPAIQNLTAAGIFVVVSAGNAGTAGCASIFQPPQVYIESFTVGSTTNSDEISSFSSKGPVKASGQWHLGPLVVAPGSNIRSSTPTNKYALMSGTSMAAPHVAGLVALLWSAHPDLIGQIEQTEERIQQTATPFYSTVCGDTSTARPNNVFGWGRIDALAAVQTTGCHLPGDFDCSCHTDIGDLMTLVKRWMVTPVEEKYDLNHDHQVDAADLGLETQMWGSTCAIIN